jgi:hypothetical protein
MLDKFHTVALGQGQGPVAIANINEAVSFSNFYYVLHFAKESIAAGFLHQLVFFSRCELSITHELPTLCRP